MKLETLWGNKLKVIVNRKKSFYFNFIYSAVSELKKYCKSLEQNTSMLVFKLFNWL